MRQAAQEVVRTLREAGHRALFAGGCVRDLEHGAEPKDYDIATDATPPEILRLFPKGNTVGAHFGVVLVRRGDSTSRSRLSAPRAPIRTGADRTA